MAGKPERAGSIIAHEMVGELVHQFVDQLSFYRELIQNSIDAGANHIDVSLDYDEKAAEAIMRVEDDGDGMNEHIIDNYLIVLFRSTKDDDLTKIGKFGIGFVSVFAPKPRLVRVRTARDGESWRLDFHSIKRFDKYRMPTVRDGTLVEVFKPLPRNEYAELVAESRRTVRHWCRHADTRIIFEDKVVQAVEKLNEPFDLEGGASLRHKEEGTEIVLGCAWTPKPYFGFFNRGLTLKEGEEAHFPAVQFKVKSRYLEHTLTRDNVVQDANYQKVMKLVRRLADDELPAKVLDETAALAAALSRAAAAGDEAQALRVGESWSHRLFYLRSLFEQRWTFFRDWGEKLILPCVSGNAVSVDAARDAVDEAGELYVDRRRTPITDALAEQGIPVLCSGPGQELLPELLRAPVISFASRTFMKPLLLEGTALEPRLRALLERAGAVDASSVYRYERLAAADFAYPGSAIVDELFVVQDVAGEVSRVGERPVSSFFRLGRRRRCAVINAAHPFTRRLAVLHGSRPGLASYLLLKTLHLHDGDVPPDEHSKFSSLAEKTERRLLEQALEIDAGRRPR